MFDSTPIFENIKIMRNSVEESKYGIITFFPWSRNQGNEKYGFFSRYIDNSIFKVFHLLPSGNDWYQYPCMEDVIDYLNIQFASCKKVLLLGSSMGAYASLLYSNKIKCDYVVSISPQFSINPKINNWDDRWLSDAKKINFINDDVNGSLSHSVPIYLFYDQYCDDVKHISRILDINNIHRIKVPFSGHPSGYEITETGFLLQFINDLMIKEIVATTEEVQVEIQKKKKSSLYHLLNLLKKISDENRIRKKIVIDRLVQILENRPRNDDILFDVLFVKFDFFLTENNLESAFQVIKNINAIKSLKKRKDLLLLTSLGKFSHEDAILRRFLPYVNFEFIGIDSIIELGNKLDKSQLIFYLNDILKPVVTDNPLNFDVRGAVAKIYEMVSVELAIAYLFESISFPGAPIQFYKRLAVLLFRESRVKESLSIYLDIKKNGEPDSVVYCAIANIYFLLKDLPKANLFLIEGLIIFPHDLKLLKLIVEVNIRIKDRTATIKYLEVGLTYYPEEVYFIEKSLVLGIQSDT